jgi:hypothetical protein
MRVREHICHKLQRWTDVLFVKEHRFTERAGFPLGPSTSLVVGKRNRGRNAARIGLAFSEDDRRKCNRLGTVPRKLQAPAQAGA